MNFFAGCSGLIPESKFGSIKEFFFAIDAVFLSKNILVLAMLFLLTPHGWNSTF